MVLAIVLGSVLKASFAAPQSWAFAFAASPRIPLVADVDNDGFADLIAVYPPEPGIIDVSLNLGAEKPGVPFQALNGWGQGCVTAVSGAFDSAPGEDIVGLFGGKTLKLAGAFDNGKFRDHGVVVDLPVTLAKPVMMASPNKSVLIGTLGSKSGFEVDIANRAVRRVSWPKPLSAQAQIGVLPSSGLPSGHVERRLGDFDKDGDQDVFEFRYGSERHTGNQILIYRALSTSETDSDKDGILNMDESVLGTDMYSSDTDGDGLLDGWETGTFRDLDLKGVGCDPRRTDVICLISRFSTVKKDTCQSELNKAVKFYKDLKTANLDGSTGFNFHPIYLDEVVGDDLNQPWWANRDKFRPAKWRGVVHWMQITPGGGGQADQLGDGGSVAENALWAVFVHEFGHQLGMDHEGFWPNNLCPTYTSLMNYAYSYGLEDDYNKIRYSDGSLKDYVLRETDLDETIPLPYDQVKFLEKGPYRFRLKASGPNTLIDWNWNGIFGEKRIKADINYSYSTNAGRRDDAGRTHSAPWLVTHENKAYAMFGQHDKTPDQSDPSIGPDKPGKLLIKRLKAPFAWEEAWTIESGGLIGDPVGVSFGGSIACFYQTGQGVLMRNIRIKGQEVSTTTPTVVDKDWSLVPTVGVYRDHLILLLTDPRTGAVSYKVYDKQGKLVRNLILDATSRNPVGITTDTLTDEVIIALAQDQEAPKSNRWQIRRYKFEKGKLVPTTMEWVEGEKGGTRGTGRLVALFDRSAEAGPDGRIYLFGKGMTDEKTPWACTYVAHQISDKTVRGGWLVKRYYDEWTQTRSAPAAAWFDGDVIWAYRWVDGGQGASDNILHVGYRALGIQSEPMGDHDDLTFLRTWGIKSSITYMEP